MIKLKDILKEEGTYVPGSIKTTHKMNVPSMGYSTPESKRATIGSTFTSLILLFTYLWKNSRFRSDGFVGTLLLSISLW